MIPLLRPATRADTPTLLDIERECFSNPHGKSENFVAGDCQVAEVDHCIAGFLVSKQIFAGDENGPPEREILNLAVRRTFRRLGIGSALLKQEFDRQASYFLEVRESNLAAQALYRGFGFIEVGRRHGYYSSPVESAIVMRMKWC